MGSAPELSGWPNVSISKQKGTVRVAMRPPRVELNSPSAPELSGWPNVSISKQKGTVRVASQSLRVEEFLECPRALCVAKCKHFQAKRHCASGQSVSPRRGVSRVPQELSGWQNVSISKLGGPWEA